MSDGPTRRRFPYVAAALCAACVGAVVWAWLRYSYAWDVTPAMFHRGEVRDGAFVRLRGKTAWVSCAPAEEALDPQPDPGSTLRLDPNDVPPDVVFFPGDPCHGLYLTESAGGKEYFVQVAESVYVKELAEGICSEGRVSSVAGYDPEVTGFATVTQGESRWHPATVASLIAAAVSCLLLAAALDRWLGWTRGWLLASPEPERLSATPRVAARVLFCLEELERLETTKPDNAWLWRLRAKVVDFVVRSHGLRELAEAYDLTDEEKAEIARTDELLHPSASRSPFTESDEIRKVREELRRRLEGLSTLGRPA
ncbi:MAG: hypothetical protein ACYS9X_24300 [Planctomycetota bacterium]|jgi:hypothetical protein